MRSIDSVLARVESGVEVVIERNARPVAVLRAAEPPPPKLSEIAALLPADSTATVDLSFEADVQAAMDAHREPPNPPRWD